jgi:hypothetical protein
LPLLALLALPLANAALTRALVKVDVRRPIRRALDLFLSYSQRVRALDAQAGGWAVAPLVLLLAAVLCHAPAMAARTGFPPDEFPVAASAALARLPETVRLLAPDKFGGYLIYRFEGRRKVYFDGRSDFYGIEFMKEYVNLVELRPGWRDILSKYEFSHALVPSNYAMAGTLELLGWKILYQDKTATLLEKKP